MQGDAEIVGRVERSDTRRDAWNGGFRGAQPTLRAGAGMRRGWPDAAPAPIRHAWGRGTRSERPSPDGEAGARGESRRWTLRRAAPVEGDACGEVCAGCVLVLSLEDANKLSAVDGDGGVDWIGLKS